MDAPRRLFGLAASLAGTLGQLGVIAATAPPVRECLWSACLYGGDPGPVELFVGWEPYIDNAGVGLRRSSERRCPGRASGSGFRIDYAPLPAGFDVHAFPQGDILACVALGADGSVEAVRIVAGTGRARLDERLLRLIHRQWRFRPVDGAERGPRWQRVRLNSGHGIGPMLPVPPPPL